MHFFGEYGWRRLQVSLACAYIHEGNLRTVFVKEGGAVLLDLFDSMLRALLIKLELRQVLVERCVIEVSAAAFSIFNDDHGLATFHFRRHDYIFVYHVAVLRYIIVS